MEGVDTHPLTASAGPEGCNVDGAGPPSSSSSRRQRRLADAASSSSASAAASASTRRRAAAKATASLKPSKRRRRGFVCVCCRRLKVVCTGAFPCDRCWRLALPCRPQTATPDHAPTNCAPPFSGGGDSRAPTPCGEEGPASPLTTATRPPQLELVFARATPQANAELLSQAFMELYASGRVVRERALFAMRLYADLSQVFGSDPSYGFGDVMAKALGCSPIDLAAPEELLLDPPPAQRAAAFRKRMARVGTMERTPAGPYIRELDEQAPASALYIAVMAEDGAMGYTTNAAFDACFQGAAGFVDDMARYKSLSCLLLASLLEPGDRKAMLEALVRVFFGEAPKRESLIVKAFDKQGEMGLYLLQVMPGCFAPPPIAGPATLAFRFERLPKSRHLSLRPGHHNQLEIYRQKDAEDAEDGAQLLLTPAPAPATPVGTEAAAAAAPTAAAPAQAAAAADMRLVPGLAAFVPCGPIDGGRMQAVGAAVAGASCLPLFPPRRLPSAALLNMKSDRGGSVDSSSPGFSSTSSSTSTSSTSGSSGGSSGGGVKPEAPDETCPSTMVPHAFPRLRIAAPALESLGAMAEGWAGVGALAGEVLSPVAAMDAELLEMLFEEEDEDGV